MTSTQKRNPLIASLLSLGTPGLGQIYNGQIIKGIIFYCIFLLWVAIVSITRLHHSFQGTLIFVLVALCIQLIFIGDALFVAIKTKRIILRFFNKWYFYLLIIILNMIINSFIQADALGVKAFKVSSSSMSPTLLVGDNIIVDIKYFKFKKPQRGDVILFKYSKNPTRHFIKRVIGVEGDEIEGKDKIIYLNRKPIIESSTQHFDSDILLNETDIRDNFGPIYVPPGRLFVIGDNRDQSIDSRYFGFVHFNDLKGKVLYIYWSRSKDRIGLTIK